MLYYLGIDCSTQKIGIALLTKSKAIKHSTCLKLKSTDTLEYRAQAFAEEIKKITKDKRIDKVFVEAPFIAFHGGAGQAATTAILQRFNGMVCYILYAILGYEPILLNPNKVRSTLGIKIDRKKKTPREKKKPIIDFITEQYKNTSTPFTYDLTPQGNFKPGTDDKCDAICLVLAGIKMGLV